MLVLLAPGVGMGGSATETDELDVSVPMSGAAFSSEGVALSGSHRPGQTSL